MEKEFIPYEQALVLKELGFDKSCFGKFYYNQLEIGGNWCNNDFKEDPDVFISAPLYQQSFRWFREKQNLKPDVTHATSNGGYTYTIWKWNFDNNVGKWERIGVINSWMTYEEAQFECLKKLIEIVKNK